MTPKQVPHESGVSEYFIVGKYVSRFPCKYETEFRYLLLFPRL